MKDLKSFLNTVDISADWIGLREVKETKTFRSIRDLNPQSNTKVNSHGVMVEVLKQGQFGYAATNDLTISGINKAASKAAGNADSASIKSLFKFTPDVRPKAVGNYQSPYINALT